MFLEITQLQLIILKPLEKRLLLLVIILIVVIQELLPSVQVQLQVEQIPLQVVQAQLVGIHLLLLVKVLA